MKKTGIVALLAAAALTMTACGTNANLKKTAMEIGNVKVTAGDIAVMANSMNTGGDFDSVKKSVADEMEDSFKYEAAAKALGLELSEEEEQNAVSIRANYAQRSGGYKAYKKYLESNGSSVDFIDKLFVASMYKTQVDEKITEELKEKETTDDELKKFYDESYYCAKHILISENSTKLDGKTAEELANDLLDKAKNGGNFDELMKEYTEDPGSESNPDGYVFTDGQMVSEFENKVKELKPGEYGVCKSSYGYHVILRLDLPAFEDNKDEVKSAYETKRLEIRLDEICEENGVKIEVFDDVLEKITEDMIKKAATADAE